MKPQKLNRSLGGGLSGEVFAVALMVALLASPWAQAQSPSPHANYPDKPIKMIVPYVAGGAADITARLVAQSMSETMGQVVLVDNKPGANGNIGADMVAKV